jgi:hypothetical protein
MVMKTWLAETRRGWEDDFIWQTRFVR